jgi:Fic family protein
MYWGSSVRLYEETHPWITFRLDLQRELDHECWMLLGEAVSKLEHIAGVPLRPDVAEELNSIYLSKGAHATTQIEGNTLSEEEVRRRVDDDLKLPPSQEYLGQEIDNVVRGYNLIVDEVAERRPLALTTGRITKFNEIVLDRLPTEGDGRPGQIRTTSVTVGNHYRGAPAEDCAYLLNRLCEWLDSLRAQSSGILRTPLAILAAIMAHLYTAWIHPFEDGNGRTARLIEFQLLVQAGAPTVAAHVLADHYNKTRTEYYRHLRRTSQEPYSLTGLIKYALQGLVDGLRSQIGEIQNQQLALTWENHVYSLFHDRDTPACSRQRKLILSLPVDRPIPKSKIQELTPTLAVAYAGKKEKTVSRDINALANMGLLLKIRRGPLMYVKPRIEILRAFMPLRANEDA